MIDIKAEGVEFIYVPTSNVGMLFENKENYNFKVPCSFMKNNISKAIDYRVTLFPNMFRIRGSRLYYLFWFKKKDLFKLDETVRKKMYSDDDFMDSIKTIYQKTHCLSCNETFNTLVISSGDPYLGAPELMEKKVQKANFLVCPSCNNPLRQMVVKIF